MLEDFIVYEENIYHGLVLFRNCVELVPIIILSWIFQEKITKYDINKDPLSI